jgi:hypothetical protein
MTITSREEPAMAIPGPTRQLVDDTTHNQLHASKDRTLTTGPAVDMKLGRAPLERSSDEDKTRSAPMHTSSNLFADACQAELRNNGGAGVGHAGRDHARVRDRLAARWRAHRLDRELATGVAPHTRAGLSVRAQTLVEPPVRAVFGRQLQRVVRDARDGRVSLGARIRPRSSEVLAAADQLDALADRLLAPAPVDARGVAQVRLLLSDGAGPLYYRGATEDLRSAAGRALRYLYPEEQR